MRILQGLKRHSVSIVSWPFGEIGLTFLVQLLLSYKQEGDIGPSRTYGLAPPNFCGSSVLFKFLFFSFPFVFVLLLVFGVRIVLLYKYLFLLGY
jgi:hypothetical protein